MSELTGHRKAPRTRAGTLACGASGQTAARCLAALAALCLLAACTGSPPGASALGAGRHAFPPHGPIGRPRFAPHVLIISGASGGSAPAIFIGGVGGGGSRPKITVPPVPPVGSSLTIPMPLDAYQAISTQQQEALADASALLIQRCMAARGFEDTSSANPPFSTVVTLEQVETAGAGLTSSTQARVFGFVHPKNRVPALGPADHRHRQRGRVRPVAEGRPCLRRGPVRVRPGYRDRPGWSSGLPATSE